MNRRVLPLIIGSLLLLLGCGGNGTGPPTVVSIAVEGPPGAVTSVGESAPFFATASLSDGTSQDVTADAQWTSSDPSVVTVSATGAGEAVGVGQSEICATYQGVSGCVLVTVTAPVAISIAVEGPPGAVTSVGESGLFIAVATFSDGTSQDVTADAQWTSSDPSVVTVSATGAGEAVGVGQSEICATYQGVSGCVLVTVTAPVATTSVNVVDFAFDPSDILVSGGATVTWTWTGAIGHNVTFISASVSAPSATQAAGTFQVTMPMATGTYDYQCTIHPTLMNGTVTVQ